MKEGKTLQELAVELKRQRTTIRDFRSPTRLLNFSPDGGLNILLSAATDATSHRFGTNRLFLQQLAAWAGIPQKYLDRMAAEAPALMAENINHWLEAQDEVRLVRTLDGTARSFLSHRYRCLDNVDVIEAVLPTFAERGITSVSAEITPEHLWLKGVNARRTIEVKRGDPIQLGVVISNSEVGLGAVHVDPLIYRLVCLNGAIVADAGLRKFHIGRRLRDLDETVEVFQDDTRAADDRAFFLKLRDVVNAAFDEAQMTDLLRSIEEGAQRRLGEGRFLEETVETTAQRYGLNDAEAQGILRYLIDGGDLTQWGLANAVTRCSQGSDSYERATVLEKIGGTIMTLPEPDWRELAA